jgi:hypothetical protein
MAPFKVKVIRQEAKTLVHVNFPRKYKKCISFIMTAGPLRENNGPLKVLLSQSQSAISAEVMLAI